MSYICKEDFIEYLDERLKSPYADDKEIKVIGSISEKLIARTPTANVKPVVMAPWIRSEISNSLTGQPIVVYYCGNCRTLGTPLSKFCSECGAEMFGESIEK